MKKVVEEDGKRVGEEDVGKRAQKMPQGKPVVNPKHTK